LAFSKKICELVHSQRVANYNLCHLWSRSYSRETTIYGSVDPKFSTEFCRQRQLHKKSDGGGAIGAAQTSTKPIVC